MEIEEANKDNVPTVGCCSYWKVGTGIGVFIGLILSAVCGVLLGPAGILIGVLVGYWLALLLSFVVALLKGLACGCSCPSSLAKKIGGVVFLGLIITGVSLFFLWPRRVCIDYAVQGTRITVDFAEPSVEIGVRIPIEVANSNYLGLYLPSVRGDLLYASVVLGGADLPDITVEPVKNSTVEVIAIMKSNSAGDNAAAVTKYIEDCATPTVAIPPELPTETDMSLRLKLTLKLGNKELVYELPKLDFVVPCLVAPALGPLNVTQAITQEEEKGEEKCVFEGL